MYSARVGSIFDEAARTLELTDFAVACPIATVALEVASTNERLRVATAEVFDAWIASGAERFESAGMSPDKALTLALTLISLLEGAFILSQSLKSAKPVRAAGISAVAVAQSALDARARTRGAAAHDHRG